MVCSEVIKARTKKMHAETESVLIPRIKEITNRQGYVELLALFYGFFEPLEKRISDFINTDTLPDIHTRRKSGSIIKSMSNVAFTIVATPGRLPVIHNVAQAFGAMYVLEGSTLGGKIISRMLQANVSLQLSTDSLAFFDVYGDETFEMWSRFKTVMDTLLINDTDINAASEAAGDTFSKMKSWMQNPHS